MRDDAVLEPMIAVFYRTNAMSRAVEEAPSRPPFLPDRQGVENFFHRREIKDVLAYLRLLINPADEFRSCDINRRPRHRETTGQKIVAQPRAQVRMSVVILGTGRRAGLDFFGHRRIERSPPHDRRLRRKIDRRWPKSSATSIAAPG